MVASTVINHISVFSYEKLTTNAILSNDVLIRITLKSLVNDGYLAIHKDWVV